MPKNPLKERGKAFEPRKIFLWTFLITTMAYLLWLGGIFAAPYLRSQSWPWSRLVYSFYSPVCHQVAERSFLCFGQPLAVCGRCTGIYLGFLLGLGLYPFLKGWGRVSFPASRLFFIVSVPILLDTAANFFGLWQTPNVARLVTGVLWGIILPHYFIPGVADFFITHQKNRLKSTQGSP